MRLNAKELIADARVTAPTLPPAAAKLMTEMADRLDVQFAALCESREQVKQLAAENAIKHEFIATCFRAAADGASLDGADIQELGERLGLFERQTYQPALHGYICGHESGEDTVYVLKKSTATDAFLASLRAEARKQGAIFSANRMLAAWDAGFVDDTPENAADIARAILSMTEFMDDAPEGDFDRSFADEMLTAIAAQLRSQSAPSPESIQSEQLKGNAGESQ